MDDSVSLTKFLSRSREFHARNGRAVTSSTTLEKLIISRTISETDARRYIGSTRIIVHPYARHIASQFLAYKAIHGSHTEKHVYSRLNWHVDGFLVRLIEMRPLTFYSSSDRTLLRNRKQFDNARAEWDKVGSDHEGKHITMRDYLSYDEQMMASLIGISGHTPYFNDGDRNNRGHKGPPGSYQREGVTIGLVGARFERPDRMDAIYCFAPLGSMPPARFFPFALYLHGHDFESRYKSRMRITAETLLMEADGRACDAKKKAYLHIPGLGLGMWRVAVEQRKWYVEVFMAALDQVKPRNIAILEFGHFPVDWKTQMGVIKAAARYRASCYFNNRAPSAKLAQRDLLLITTYTWNGNAYPGNEFYTGKLDNSGAPAAACSSAIAETHNPEINTNMLKTIRLLK